MSQFILLNICQPSFFIVAGISNDRSLNGQECDAEHVLLKFGWVLNAEWSWLVLVFLALMNQ